MASRAQIQFWYNFATIKRNAIYINRYHQKIQEIDRKLNMVSAIASSSSIGAWLIWKDAWFIWTGVIAASQVITVIKPHLRFKEQLTALSMFGPELDGLALAAEEGWFAVSHGRLTDDEIHKQTIGLKRKVQSAEYKAFKGMSIKDDVKLQGVAEAESLAYMAIIAGDDDGPTETAKIPNDREEGVGVAGATGYGSCAQSFPTEGAQPAQEIGVPNDRDQTTAE